MFNWIDMVVAVAVAFYVWEGWKEGLFKLIAELLVFLGSLWLAIQFHSQVGIFVTEKFGTPQIWAEVVGYVVVAVLADLLLVNLAVLSLKLIPKNWHLSRLNQGLGVVASGLKAMVIMAFVLLVIQALPLRGTIKSDIEKSLLGSRLVSLGGRYGGEVVTTIDKAALEAAKFVTIRPESNEKVDLNFEDQACKYEMDAQAEAEMLTLVNSERSKAGVGGLRVDLQIVGVARKHSQDMFERSYFSHINPEGKSAGERLDDDGVKYTFAGENLAFAPSVEIAHQGLMDSPGHRKNILDGRYSRVGIGVIDGGGCGMMFTQNFAN